MGSADDEIAKAVLDTYDTLSPKYKPVKSTADFFQWVPLSGIVVVKGPSLHITKTPQLDEFNNC